MSQAGEQAAWWEITIIRLTRRKPLAEKINRLFQFMNITQQSKTLQIYWKTIIARIALANRRFLSNRSLIGVQSNTKQLTKIINSNGNDNSK